jgi:GH24 family phage-related lysozyme (muramidase)
MNWIDLLVEALLGFEGMVQWLYCDKKGFVTIGIGSLVPDDLAAVRLPLYLQPSSAAATDAEKRMAWRKVHSAFPHDDPAPMAGFYKNLTNVRLRKQDALAMCRSHIEGDVRNLKRLFHDFDSWSDSAKMATVDLVYSMGFGRYSSFVNHIDACINRRWDLAAKECSRADARPARNRWTRELFEKAWGETK